MHRPRWGGCPGWKGVSNTVKEISFLPFFLWSMTFAFFNFLNLDSVNCHRAATTPAWVLEKLTFPANYPDQWPCLGYQRVRGRREAVRVAVPRPTIAIQPFEVPSYLCNVQTCILKQRHILITHRKPPLSPLRDPHLILRGVDRSPISERPSAASSRRGYVVALPFCCEWLSRPRLPCELSRKSDDTDDWHAQAAQQNVHLSKVLLLEEKLRSCLLPHRHGMRSKVTPGSSGGKIIFLSSGFDSGRLAAFFF